MMHEGIEEFLNKKYDQYNRTSFIETDPISIPHRFSKKEDIEIAGFLSATIAWGQRKTIIKNASRLTEWMDMVPHEFIMNSSKKELRCFAKFKHRTFNGTDCIYFLESLKNIYQKHKGLENIFRAGFSGANSKNAIAHFRKVFFEIKHPQRTTKHVSNPEDNSAAKRINMYLRWMIRKDKRGVDFGLWKISPSLLCCPLDVHSGNVARKLGLLTRSQNDWKAVEELTGMLRQFDADDPVKYDFALFGLGAFEKF